MGMLLSLRRRKQTHTDSQGGLRRNFLQKWLNISVWNILQASKVFALVGGHQERPVHITVVPPYAKCII